MFYSILSSEGCDYITNMTNILNSGLSDDDSYLTKETLAV